MKTVALLRFLFVCCSFNILKYWLKVGRVYGAGDKAITGLRAMVESYTNHYDPNKADAATVLSANIAQHGNNIQRHNYSEQTAVLRSIAQDWTTIPKLANAVATLNIVDWLAEMKRVNILFGEKFRARAEETATNSSAKMAALREEATTAYNLLISHAEAHSVLGGSESFTRIVNTVSTIAGKYNQRISNRSNTNGNEDTITQPTPDVSGDVVTP